MVAKITIPKSIQAVLNYNEKKVQKGAAECLYAANYLSDIKDMNFHQKLNGFQMLNDLNDRATTKTIHISLNFDSSEKLSDNKLIEVANVYMEKIGFVQQPFLIYKHEDAGHPHIHIVSNTIKADGSRINTHNIGRNQSEKARKEIEQIYGLVKAERQQQLMRPGIKPVDAQKAVYGKSETKRSISNVVGAVFSDYKFTSLPEFNAALKQFNVVADRGGEEGRIYKNRGLVYRILDGGGNKVGVPIKASSIACKATLDKLERKFAINKFAREQFKVQMKNTIEACLKISGNSMHNLTSALTEQKIATVIRQNAEGRIYGITFVDNQNKAVFNGSDLGKEFSVAGLQSRLSGAREKDSMQVEKILTPNRRGDTRFTGANTQPEIRVQKEQVKTVELEAKNDQVLNILFSTNQQVDNSPSLLLKRKRKKKKLNNMHKL